MDATIRQSAFSAAKTFVLGLVASLMIALGLALTLPPTTSAYASEESIAVGDQITFTIEQQVNELGTNAFVRYEAMAIDDVLAPELKYISAALYLGDKDITSEAGQVVYNAESNSVSFVFSEDYLANGMALEGETYRFEIVTEVLEVPDDKQINNISQTIINSTSLTSNETIIDIDNPNIIVTKKADKEVYAASEPIAYTVTITQDAAHAAVEDITVVDDIPDSLTLNAQSVTVQGSGNPQATTSGNKITVIADRLNANESITLKYSCTLADPSQAGSITNTVTVNNDKFVLDQEEVITVTPPVTYVVDNSTVFTDNDVVAGSVYQPIDSVETNNTKEDATFSGWYLDQDLKTPYDPSTNGKTDGGFTLYAKNIFTINASADQGGSISQPGTTNYYYADNATYTITPNEHWQIDYVEVDGVNKGAVGSFTFDNISANHTIEAHFKPITFTVTFVDELTGKEIDKQTIQEGSGATDPGIPEHEGYTNNGWDKDFTNITEDTVVTVTYTNIPTKLTINKTWNDDNNRDGVRSAATFDIKGTVDDGKTEVYSGQATIEPDQTQTVVENLPSYSGVKQVVYSVTEQDLANYEEQVSAIDGTWSDGWTVNATNNYSIATTDITINKTWNDDNNEDQIRPETITTTLSGSDGSTQQVTLSADSWSTTIEDLPVYYNHGQTIEYSVSEDAINGYALTNNSKSEDGYTFDLTNKQIMYNVIFKDGLTGETVDEQLIQEGSGATDPGAPEHEGYDFTGWDKDFSNITGDLIVTAQYQVKATSLTINKTWNDDNNRDGVRKDATFSVVGTIGQGDSVETVYEGSATIKADQTQIVVNDLPAYKDLERVAYSISENEMEGYTNSIGAIQGTWSDGWSFSVTNTHDIALTSATISKTWNDDNDRDGLRPGSIELSLDGTDGSSREVVLSDANSWTATLDNLPVYTDGGVGINYSVSEQDVNGYSFDVTCPADTWNFTLTNTHEIETIDIPVDIAWDDDGNRDGLRPDSVKLTLTGSDGSQHELKVTEAASWENIFTDLPRYYDNGTEIEYSVSVDAPDGYSYSVDGDNTGFTITNTHEIATRNVVVEKIWDDANDQDGARPQSVEVELIGSDGSTYEATLSEAENWTYTWTDIPVNQPEGVAIDYSINELLTDDTYGAQSSLTTLPNGDYHFELVNSHTPATIHVAISATWADDNDRDGLRPDTQTVTLIGSDGSSKELTLDAQSGWSTLVEDLPMFNNGTLIDYEVETNPADGYKAEISNNGYALTVEFTHVPDTRSIAVTKHWLDDDNALNTRTNAEFTLTGSDGSTYTQALDALTTEETIVFDDLYVYYDHGQEIDYRLSEAVIAGYVVDIQESENVYDNTLSYDVTNTLQETLNIPVRKVWMADNSEDRPDHISFHLLRDGEVIASLDANEESSWSATFEGIERFDEKGKEIAYEVAESRVDSYSTEYVGSATEGFTVTNTLQPQPVADNPVVSVAQDIYDKTGGTIMWILFGIAVFVSAATTLLIYAIREKRLS